MSLLAQMMLVTSLALPGADTPVPREAVTMQDGRAFVNCQWLQQNRIDLSCRQTPDSVTLSDTFWPVVVWSIDRKGTGTYHPTAGNTVQRQFTPPLKLGLLIPEYWLAARDLTLLLGVPVRWDSGRLWLGPTPGFQRSQAKQIKASKALVQTRKQRGLPPLTGHLEGQEDVLLVPASSADLACSWVEHQVTCWNWQHEGWKQTWQATTGRHPFDPWPQKTASALNAVLGDTTTLSGNKPVWFDGLAYEVRGGSGMSRSVRRGRVAPGGLWTQVYEKAGLIDDAFAPPEF